jgi:FPC/CPF motif-containing protein YcgG
VIFKSPREIATFNTSHLILIQAMKAVHIEERKDLLRQIPDNLDILA